MKPKIFLSHSTKSDLSEALLTALSERLKGSFDVLLDRERLAPGMKWRAKLHHWLGICDGAVVFFSPEAVGSDWVRSEANILGWRYAREREFRLVPVLLHGVSRAEAGLEGFKPVALEELQFVRETAVDPAADQDGYVDSLVSQVAGALQGFTARIEDPLLIDWVESVAAVLELARAHHLKRVAERLNVQQQDLDTYADEREVLLAHQFFHAEIGQVAMALDPLSQSLREEADREDLRKLIAPNWVPAASARDLAAIAAVPEGLQRNLVLRTDLLAIGEEFIRRAYCCSADLRILSDHGANGESGAEDRDGYLRGFLRRSGRVLELEAWDGKSEAARLADVTREVERQMRNPYRRWFVVFGPRAIGLGLPGELRSTFAGMTFVLLSKDGRLGGLDAAEVLEPVLTDGQLAIREDAQSDLRGWVKPELTDDQRRSA